MYIRILHICQLLRMIGVCSDMIILLLPVYQNKSLSQRCELLQLVKNEKTKMILARQRGLTLESLLRPQSKLVQMIPHLLIGQIHI